MFFEVILAAFCGIGLGIITGLIPGVHINLVAVLLFALAGLGYVNPFMICITIICTAVTHTFLDTIPSVFLGCPEADNCLSVLPGHRLLLEGKGYMAVMLTVIGSLGGLIASVALVPLLLQIVSTIYEFLKDYIGYILLLISVFLIYREGKSRLWALIVFVLCGVFALNVFNVTMKEPLFPLFSGMFGISMLILSSSSKIPEQKSFEIEMDKKEAGKAISCSVVVGWICSFMPGLGPSQAAIIGSQFVKLTNNGFLILVGGLSTVNMVLSLVTLYALEKARNGAVVTVLNIMETVSIRELTIFVAVALIAGGCAVILASFLSKKFAVLMNKVNYKALVYSVIALIIILVFLICGWKGWVILFFSTWIGIIPQVKGIGRNHMMGSLLLPVILFFIL